MSDFPQEWSSEKLGDIADIRISNVDKKMISSEVPVRLCNYMDVYSRDYINASDEFMSASATTSEVKRFALREGDVVITKDSESPDDIGIPALIKTTSDDLVCGYHLAILRPSARLDGSWLAKQLGHERAKRYFAKVATGSTRYGLSNSSIKNFEVWLPSVDEQRSAIQVLRTLDDAIQKTEQLINKLKQIKQGLLHDLLTRGIDENGQLRDPIAHPEQFKDSVLGRIPLEWSVLSLASVVADIPHAIVDGPFGSNLKTEHYRERGVPVIQSGFVTSGEFQADSYVYVDQSLVEAQKRSIAHPGDIIMAKIGTQCGACAVMPDGHSEGILAGNSLKISLDSSVCRTQYALKVFHYYHDTGVLDLIKTETAQPAISLRNLKSLLLPIPRVDEQNRIITVLNAQDRQKLEEIKSLSKLLEVRKCLMRDLLTGKVRVPVRKELKNVW